MEEAKEKGKELQEERKRLVADADDGDDKMTFLVSVYLILFCFRPFPNAEC
jgi:hypothetical protein